MLKSIYYTKNLLTKKPEVLYTLIKSIKIMFKYDLIVIGAGAAGMMAAITAAREGKKVLILEKLSQPGAKLKATGGGRCNLTNTLAKDEFISRFGKNGKFMTTALNRFDNNNLRDFFTQLGVNTHSPDGFRVFPLTHNAQTILTALIKEIKQLGITLLCSQRVKTISTKENSITGVITQDNTFYTKNVAIATGGLGYPMLGAEGDGYKLAKKLGHKITDLYPAMVTLKTKQKWVQNCRADTVAGVTIKIDQTKTKKILAKGDLIFTKDGLAGPVILDFSREVTPLLERYTEIPLLLNMTKGMHEDQIYTYLKNSFTKNPQASICQLLLKLLPKSLSIQLCTQCNIDPSSKLNKIPGRNRDELIKILAWTPITITGNAGFEKAMITRGGISLKEIDPKTMQSKLLKGLFFCGEIVDLDGPCGGYNLQWSFTSGFLAGISV